MSLYFSNISIFPGDEDYRRRELRDGWRERRATGIISQDTEQDAFVIETDIDDPSDTNIGERIDSEPCLSALRSGRGSPDRFDKKVQLHIFF